MFSDLGFSEQKMYFLFKMLLMIVNEGSSFLKTIIFLNDSFFPNEKLPFIKTIFKKYSFKNDRFVFLKSGNRSIPRFRILKV